MAKFKTAYKQLSKFRMGMIESSPETWLITSRLNNGKAVFLKNQNGSAVMIAHIWDGEKWKPVHSKYTIKAMIEHLTEGQ